MTRIAIAIITAIVAVMAAAVAFGYPPATTPEITQTTVKIGNLDCNTRYQFRVREHRNGSWRDSTLFERTTAACSTPPPPPPQCSDGVNNDPGEDSLVDLADPGCSSATDNTELGNPAPPPPTGYATVQPDGGTDYCGRFSNPFPTAASWFPVGVWGAYGQFAAERDLDAAAGINTYVWAADVGLYDEIAADGRFEILADSGARDNANARTHANAWVLHDEIEMQQGPSACNGSLQDIKNSLPPDGKVRYNNYGKGIFPGWETDAQFACFVNAQDVTSDDIYWFTDPHACTSLAEGPSFFGLNRALTQAECRRAANYGYVVDRMRALDVFNGSPRQPIWAFVEVSHPFPESGQTLTAAQVRAAVWHSLIAGARGIIYFQHTFQQDSPCFGHHHTLRDNCHGMRQPVTDLNAQIRSLAPVLNSPTVTSGITATSSVRVMGKLGTDLHVFAASKENVASTATIRVQPGPTTATVVGEGRTIPIAADGSFTDSFANGNAVHIYRIPGA